MNAGNMELPKQHHHVSADEGDVHVAGAWAFAVERFVGPELVAGYRAAAQDDVDTSWRRVAQFPDEFIVSARVVAEHEAYNPLTHFTLALRVSCVGVEIRLGIRGLAAVGVGVFRHQS